MSKLRLSDLKYETIRKHIKRIKAKDGALEDNLTAAFASMYVAGWNHDQQSAEELIQKESRECL